jgi:hypothetical protein
MTTVWFAVWTTVEIEKLAVADPARTVTLAGTVATEGVPLVRVTTMPPAGAFAESVTVPVLELPPTTLAGERVTLESDCPSAGTEDRRATATIASRPKPPARARIRTHPRTPTGSRIESSGRPSEIERPAAALSPAISAVSTYVSAGTPCWG